MIRVSPKGIGLVFFLILRIECFIVIVIVCAALRLFSPEPRNAVSFVFNTIHNDASQAMIVVRMNLRQLLV